MSVLKKKAQVILLPTNKESNIWKQGLLNKLSSGDLQPKSSTGFNLYFLSDEEIKELPK